MQQMECPFCGCRVFYVKDPEDEYETHEFERKNGAVIFGAGGSGGARPEVTEKTEIFCNQCVWHGVFTECASG